MYLYKDNNDHEFHQVGQFFTHFHEDMDKISEALFNAGYYICRTIHGDMIIMRRGNYDEEEVFELDSDFDNFDDDDEDGGTTGGDNLRHFPKEY